jgi:ABC-type nitrate/sulfonate/bicarbonate transport system substrate-binding protein
VNAGRPIELSTAKAETMAPMTMTIERVRTFNGLDVLVARDGGLFEAEGLDLRIVGLSRLWD